MIGIAAMLMLTVGVPFSIAGMSAVTETTIEENSELLKRQSPEELATSLTQEPVKENSETQLSEETATEILETQPSESIETENSTVTTESQEPETSTDESQIEPEEELVLDQAKRAPAETGDFQVDGNAGGITYANNILQLSGDNQTYTVSMKTPNQTTNANRIEVTGTNITVKLNSVKIDQSDVENSAAFLIAADASATVDLIGTNILESGKNCAGLQNDSSADNSLIITSDVGTYSGYAGELTAIGGHSGSGIGGGYKGEGKVTIHGGNISATGGISSSGIGGGSAAKGEVTIYGGNISATGENYGPGIGGGSGADGIVIIQGGTVSAIGRMNASGIGGGSNGDGIVTIQGGIVSATGGNNGSGIGGGAIGAGTVNIQAGTITVSGATDGADLGIGTHGSVANSSVTIQGGSVKAVNNNIEPAPEDDTGKPVHRYQASASAYTEGQRVKATDKDFQVNGKHEGDESFYLYLPEDKHVVSVSDNESYIEWLSDESDFRAAATYSLSVPASVQLAENNEKTESVTLQNRFYQVPGYTSAVAAKIQAGSLQDNKLKMTDPLDESRAIFSMITWQDGLEPTLASNAETKNAPVTFGKPEAASGNHPIQAGSYSGTLTFEVGYIP